MADQKQLDRLLEEGVQAWNEWRAENLGVELNLRGAFCSDADLTGADLRNAIPSRPSPTMPSSPTPSSPTPSSSLPTSPMLTLVAPASGLQSLGMLI